MKKALRHTALLASMFALFACGDSHLLQDSDSPTLQQHIFVIPDRFNGQPYNYDQPATTVYLDTNETVKFWAGYSLDGVYISTDEAEDHFINLAWNIEGEEYNISPLRLKFLTPGHRQAILQTVDLMSDTLLDTVDVYVNTPLSIRAVAPIDGFNQASPVNTEVELRWDISGIDDWEKSRCFVYASFSRDSVWNNNLGKVECTEGTRLVGSFLSDSLYRYIQHHPEADTSIAIFWGIKAALFTDDGFEERDSTDIFHFTSLYLHGDSARITIPIVYENLPHGKTIFTRVILTSDAGDTLGILTNKASATSLSVKVPAQTGINIDIEERSKVEYQPQHIVVTAAPKAQTVVDTVRMKDIVQPQVALLESSVTQNDSISFYALDQGSGINQHRIHVIMDYDTLDFSYEEPFITFKNSCIGACTLRISAEDFAHNESPKVFWKINNKDSLKISGPYTDLWEDR